MLERQSTPIATTQAMRSAPPNLYFAARWGCLRPSARLSRLAHGHVVPGGWVIAGLVVLLAILILAIVLLAPTSRRWARANRLHRLAGHNDATLRASGLRDLNETLRTLESARSACIAAHRDADAGQLDALAKQIAVVRDRVASDYVPTPPNAPMSRRELDLARPQASEALLTTCARVARTVRDGAAVPPVELGAAQVALRVIDRELALQ